MLHLGARVADAWRRSPWGAAFVGLVWVLAGAVVAATAADVALRVRAAVLEHRDTRRFAVLARAYNATLTHELDAQYFFFFRRPLAAGNDVCRLDAAGFREPGPARAGHARLAFLVGGSSAFGLFATSDLTTITSYLNQLQHDYFFVNAGVPGFTSMQEFYRLSMQVLDYEPALVVTYDGANDMDLGAMGDDEVPPSTPGDFARMVELAARGRRPLLLPTAADLWPELADRWTATTADNQAAADARAPAALVDAAADRYLANLRLMADLTRARRARFLAVFQPVATLHDHVDDAFKGPTRVATRFHQRVAQADKLFAFVDFSRIFDGLFDHVPVMGADLTDDTIFVDGTHLTDRGNRMVAERLWRALAGDVLR